MSSLDLEQSISAQKASVETSFDILNKAFAGIDKLASLNLQAFKSILAENLEIAARVLSAKHPQELLSLETGQAQPAVEKAQSYWRHVYEIISSTLGDFNKTLEVQFKRYQYDWQAVVENLAKNAPAGSEAVLTAWKSAIETAGTTFESARKVTRQVTQIAGSNVTAANEAPTGSTALDVEHAESVEKK
jgi:phasin family protein